MTIRMNREDAVQRDSNDPLRSMRSRFHIPKTPAGEPVVYLCGHSLGLAPIEAATLVQQELNQWQTLGVEAHFNGHESDPRPWLSYHEQLNAGLASLTGSLPFEVVAMNSLTVNLHLMLVSFYRPTARRHKILIERAAFPSDRYAVVSQIRYHGYDPAHSLLEIGPRDGEHLLRLDDIAALLEQQGESIATMMLPGVQYLSGQRLPMREITTLAHAQGCEVGFDLAHAIGNAPLELHAWDVDFAVWCSYKYLNGSPGAIGGCFVHERHARSTTLPRFSGWWGHDDGTRFEMPEHFAAIPGAPGWQLSNPPILAMAPLVASLRLFDEAGREPLATKSKQLSGYMIELLQNRLSGRIELLTSTNPDERGSQISLRLKMSRSQARAAYESLATYHVICDWREPDVIRAAAVPLYNSFEDVWKFVDALSHVIR